MSSSGVLVFLLLGLLGQGESKEDSLEQVLASVGKDVHVVLSERGRNGTTGDNALPDREFDVAGIIENLAEIDVPITLMFGSRFSSFFPPALAPGRKCEDLPGEESLVAFGHRKNNQGSLFLVMADSAVEVQTFLSVAESTTVRHCPLTMRTGIYNRENAFLFLLGSSAEEESLGSVEVMVMSDPLVQKHRYVALVDFIDSGTLRLKRYDLFKARVHLALFPASARSAAGLFPDLPMSGAHFRVGTLPYDAYCTADENPDPLADEYHAFVNHSGFEILMLQEVAKRKGFTFELVNSPDFLWGTIANGTWTGLVSMIMREDVVGMVGAVGRFFLRQKVVISTVRFAKERLVFMSSKPSRQRNYFTLVHPLEGRVWASVLAALVLISVCLWIISDKEGKLVSMPLGHWSRLRESSWYAFGTLIGESITRDTRATSGVWMLFAFLLTAGYGGNLRAFLLRPEYSAPIDTLEKVLESGKPWEFSLSGEDVEVEMAESEHPTIKAIWDGKIAIPYEAFGFERMKKVYAGEVILIDWMNKIKTAMSIGFTLKNGEKLLEYYFIPVVQSDVELVWSFSVFNPYLERFNEILLQLNEGGLVLAMHAKIRLDLKRRFGPDIDPPTKKDDLVAPMAVGDFLGLILISAMLLTLSAIAFAVESALARGQRTTARAIPLKYM